MRVYRIASAEHADDLWTGRGGLYSESRWFPRGHRILYTSASQALAILEYMVHDRFFTYGDMVAGEAEFPEDLRVDSLDFQALAPGWNNPDPVLSAPLCGPPALRWLQQGASVALRVPSAVSQGEWNYILNPDHPDFPRIRGGLPRPLLVDPRLRQN
ncbi:MAG: RES family NAD+ phosphorylase [Gammaproteobacteria bacterium]